MGDLIAAAAVLAAVPLARRGALAAQLLAEADAAHRYVKRFGRPHPRWGDGALISRALTQSPRAAPNLSDPAFLGALATMTRAAAQTKEAAKGLSQRAVSC